MGLMKTLSASALLVSAMLIATSCQRPAEDSAAGTPDAQAIALFNGEDLTGWGFYLVDEDATMESVWSVEDGILVCKGEPMGYIHTEAGFTDFHLVVEWRWAPGGEPGNSGILTRVNGPHKALPRSIEVQLKHESAGDIFGFHGMKVSGPEERMRHVPDHKLGGELTGLSRMPEAAGVEVEPGEWNRAEVTLQGGDLKVLINGTLVNQASGCDVAAGYVALQSEGGEIHFRTIEIRPL